MNKHLHSISKNNEVDIKNISYIWDITSEYELDDAEYDRKNCIGILIFRRGNYIDYQVGDLIFDLNTISARANKYDDINNSTGCILASPRLQEFLLKYAADQVQLFDTIIRCKDKNITDYKLVNITKTAKCIDHEKSIPIWGKVEKYIRGFRKLEHIPGSMGDLLIAREEECLSNIVVSGKFVEIFKQELSDVTGFEFCLPEDMEW